MVAKTKDYIGWKRLTRRQTHWKPVMRLIESSPKGLANVGDERRRLTVAK